MEKYTAVIIEPRIHPAWSLVLKNFLTYLDPRWDFLIFCGIHNEMFLYNLINNQFADNKDRITIKNLNIDDLRDDKYNILMMKKDVYLQIPTEVFLIFQLDTLISSKYYNNIYDFIKYDYVGAPWTHIHEIGNGGLSLRRKSNILHIIDTIPPQGNEDGYFGINTKNKPSWEEAKRFSVETVFSEECFGIHKCWYYQSQQQMQKIAEHIPEIFELQRLIENR